MFILFEVTAVAMPSSVIVCLSAVSACGDPGVPEFGFRIGDGTAYSAVVQFGCPPGYLLNGDTVSRCLYNGKTTAWSHPKPTCTRELLHTVIALAACTS